MKSHKSVSADTWAKARQVLLKKEKTFTKKRDALAKERQNLPWLKVDCDYVFQGPKGNMKLADLFGKNSQLIVYHFMFGPTSKTGCKSCSLVADNFERSVVHLGARDVAFAVVSRAPLKKFAPFKKSMGWTFNWVSSHGSDFNYDYDVTSDADGEMPGINVFFKDKKGQIFRTYSTYGRGLECLMGTYRYLDIVPKGRDETDLPYGMAWVKHNNQY